MQHVVPNRATFEYSFCVSSFRCFYAPNFEEVEGAYWFDPVRLSVTLSCGYDILGTFYDMKLIIGI